MKKIFVNPEINSMELTPQDEIMAILSNSAEIASARISVSDKSQIDAEYDMWKGLGE